MSASSSEPSSSSTSAVIPWGQSPRSTAWLREQQVTFEVLDNPSLREEILKHAIIGGDKKVDHRTACTLRRVDKSWNESVLRILWKVHEPLYQLVHRDVETLEGFTKTFAVSPTTNGHPPPLNLNCYPGIYRACGIDVFSNSLSSCGPALVQLTINFYDFGDPLPVQLPVWSLPRLHKLDVILVLRRPEFLAAGEQPDTGHVGVPHETIPESLLKSVLHGATALAQLSCTVGEWFTGHPADLTIFQPLVFPPSLVKLKLEIKLNLQQTRDIVNVILKCPLPKVTSFSFTVCKDLFPDGLLFSLLDKWKTSLKCLEILAIKYKEPSRNASTVPFPVMEQLEEFSLSSTSVELETGLGSLDRCFPKLHTLRMLRKWTDSSTFSGVTSLELTLADKVVDDDDEQSNFPAGVGMELMRLVNLPFPNLRKLELGISKDDPSGLWYVFQEMRGLVELTLKVSGNLSLEGTTEEWDSILTGVPTEMMASILGSGPVSPEAGESLVPLTNLQELKSFAVKSDGVKEDGNRRSVISDFIFDHAFLRMPQLTHLHFEGPFKVSAEMGDKWMNEEGRSIVCQGFSDSD